MQIPKKLKIIQQGAEAIIIRKGDSVIKERTSKSYRHPLLDRKIIKQRTKKEAKLLDKAFVLISSVCPQNLSEIEHSNLPNKIIMPFISGKKLSEHLEQLDWKKICRIIGSQIAKLHDANIIHSDLTTSNMILVEKESRDDVQSKNPCVLPHTKGCGLSGIFGDRKLEVALSSYRNVEEPEILISGQLPQHKCERFHLGTLKYRITNENSKCGLRQFSISSKATEAEGAKKRVAIIDKNSDESSEATTTKARIAITDKKNPNYPRLYFIDFGLGFISSRIEDKAVDLHLIKQALEARHFSIWRQCWKTIQQNYDSKDRDKIFKQLDKVESRGRYKKGL